MGLDSYANLLLKYLAKASDGKMTHPESWRSHIQIAQNIVNLHGLSLGATAHAPHVHL